MSKLMVLGISDSLHREIDEPALSKPYLSLDEEQ